MKITTSQANRGISWTFQQSLEDLDFADDIALLAQRYKDIQSKTDDLVNKITANGDSTLDVENRIAKARTTFANLRNIWKSSTIRTKTKIKIFKTNVIGVFLYGSESWKVTNNITQKLDTFQTRCLRRILKIFWPNKISNEELYERTQTAAISDQIKEKRWKWIGHVLRMETSDIPRVALRWTPPGKRNRGRPRETWRRSVEKEMKEQGWTWGKVQQMSADRQRWRSSVQALCAQSTKRTK
ncbi:uncharacterized protein LOC133196968 [Saccostrea echinata]|uniref:uncharacterized protein LOC133196968 n=1 Tax=Saccostrea echinata TaxID=191078 RepID=UPI002A8401B1|nr:uncharacterized protein LOC133196968 [Saccostrea echinata]